MVDENSLIPSGNDEVMIAVMGETGSGKSSFIRLLTEDPDIRIGHGLDSESDVVKLSHFRYKDERDVTFVDTPGFDDSREGVTDADILRAIAVFLKEEYDGGRTLTGVIYLHRISDPRVGGISRAHFRMFKQLCGSDSLTNVIIVTSFWDSVKESDGMARMRELQTSPKLFQPVIDAGGKIMSHNNGLESAHSILDTILLNEPKALQIQKEMKQGKTLLETSAGSELDVRIAQLIEKHQEEMKLLRDEMAIIRKQDEARQAELKELGDKLARWQEDRKKLENGLNGTRAEASRGRIITGDPGKHPIVLAMEIDKQPDRERQPKKPKQKNGFFNFFNRGKKEIRPSKP